MSTSYTIREEADHTWTVLSQDSESDDSQIVKQGLATGAEALDFTAAPVAQVQVLPLASGRHSQAYDPVAPLSWESLPPQPDGLTFPVLALDKVLAYARGASKGLRATLTETQTYHSHTEFDIPPDDPDDPSPPTKGTVDESLEGDSKLEVSFEWGSADDDDFIRRSARRDATNPDYYQEGAVVQIAPLQVFNGGGSTEDKAKTTRKVVGTGRDQFSYETEEESQACTGGELHLGFYRGYDDKTCHLFFLAHFTGSLYQVGGASGTVELWVYANATGGDDVDFHDVYGIPQMPEGVRFIEVDDAGPEVFGVSTKLWGWKYDASVDYDPGPPDPDNHDTLEPLKASLAVDIEELTAGGS